MLVKGGPCVCISRFCCMGVKLLPVYIASDVWSSFIIMTWCLSELYWYTAQSNAQGTVSIFHPKHNGLIPTFFFKIVTQESLENVRKNCPKTFSKNHLCVHGMKNYNFSPFVLWLHVFPMQLFISYLPELSKSFCKLPAHFVLQIYTNLESLKWLFSLKMD